MDTTIIEREAMVLEPGADLQKILEIRDNAKFLVEIGKRIGAAADAALLSHIQVAGPVSVGEDLFIAAGKEKKVKCRDNGKTFKALLNAFGGSVDDVGECLASGAWKHGACNLPLGDKWEDYFETIETPILLDGVPAKKLVKINTQFLK